MARTKEYHHFCPVARSLEVIGEKWSLLIVRDLLRGPQRFSDLMRYLGGISPKWLTLRLREMEAAGLVERQSEPGRREVWYRLTDRGRDLAPVVEALAVWGIDHASRPPLPGESINPAQTISALVTYRNRRRLRLPASAIWAIRFPTGLSFTVTFDGERWSGGPGEPERDADVVIECTPEAWATFLTVRGRERPEPLSKMRVRGAPDRVAHFLAGFGVTTPAAAERSG